jgi:hypothetical protein
MVKEDVVFAIKKATLFIVFKAKLYFLNHQKFVRDPSSPPPSSINDDGEIVDGA